jgi:putative spermidine/putrescine transport system substrate-binding protein
MDLFRNKEVVMGNVWNSTTLDLRQEFGPAMWYSWDTSVVAPAVWIVPKGNPAGAKAAMEFIKVALQPAGQKEYFMRRRGASPSNPAASSLIPDNLRADDPGQPENFRRQVQLDAAWYGEHLDDVEQLYLDTISS